MNQRGATLVEALAVVAIIVVLATAFVVPSYQSYARSRACVDAATVLAEDIGLLERAAQNSQVRQGSSLIVKSREPFSYQGYLGRPAGVDPNSSLGPLIVARTFPGVALVGGPIDPATPLLFAGNGSVQYVAPTGTVARQHQTIKFALQDTGGSRAAGVDLNLFTGGVLTH